MDTTGGGELVQLPDQIKLSLDVNLRIFKVIAQVNGRHDSSHSDVGAGVAYATFQESDHLILRILVILKGLQRRQSLLNSAALPEFLHEVLELVAPLIAVPVGCLYINAVGVVQVAVGMRAANISPITR